MAEDNDNYFINTSLCPDLRSAEKSTDLGQGTGRLHWTRGHSGAERGCSVPAAQCRGQPERMPPADGAGHAPPPRCPQAAPLGQCPEGARPGGGAPPKCSGPNRAEPGRERFARQPAGRGVRAGPAAG